MNKALVWIRNISFIIVLLLMFLSFSGLSCIGISDGEQDYRLWLTIIGILIFIQLIVLFVKKNKCNLDNRYSLLMIGANIIFIVIYLRSMFDTNIIGTYITTNYNSDDIALRYAFLNQNYPLLTLIYLALFIYPFTYIKVRKNEK